MLVTRNCFLSQISYFIQVFLDILVGKFVVDQVASQVFVVRGHVDKSVSGEVEQDDFLFACLLTLVGFADGGGDGVARFGSRDDTFDLCKQYAGIKLFQLSDVYSLH